MQRSTFISIFCCSIFSLIGLSSSCQTLEWVNQTGNTNWDEGIAIAVDNNGNVYCTGNFQGPMDFDPGDATFNLTAQGSKDIFITKSDPSGNLIWAKRIGGVGWEESNALTIDPNGNILITGSFLGNTDFDPGDETFILSTEDDIEAFICKLDSAGEFIWANQTGGSLAVNSFAVTTDEEGNIFTTGYFDGVADLDPGSGTYELTVQAYSDMYVRKLDPSGDFIWAKQFAGNQGAVGHAIAVDESGNVYTTGTFAFTVDFDPGEDTFILEAPGEQDIFISKLDSSGNFAWAKQVGGEVGYFITVDNVGNVYTTGYYGWNDISINKHSPSGDIIWEKQIGAFVCYAIALDEDGNLYTTGQFFGTRDFDPGPGIYNLTATGSTDSYINKLDSSGNFVWVKQLGGTSEVLSRSLTMDGNGNIYTLGTFNGTADFDPGAETYELTSEGSYDIYLHKMGSSNGVGVIENSFSEEFNVYPNPTEGKVIVEFGKNHKNLSLVLRNAAGQIIEEKSVNNSNRVEQEIHGSVGIYILEISDQNNQVAVVRILIK